MRKVVRDARGAGAAERAPAAARPARERGAGTGARAAPQGAAERIRTPAATAQGAEGAEPSRQPGTTAPGPLQTAAAAARGARWLESSSATRKASSSAWLAFSRGSQAVW